MGSGRDHISDDGSLSRWELRLTLLSYALKINMRVAGLESPDSEVRATRFSGKRSDDNEWDIVHM